jgi:hypothetical protein
MADERYCCACDEPIEGEGVVFWEVDGEWMCDPCHESLKPGGERLVADA